MNIIVKITKENLSNEDIKYVSCRYDNNEMVLIISDLPSWSKTKQLNINNWDGLIEIYPLFSTIEIEKGNSKYEVNLETGNLERINNN